MKAIVCVSNSPWKSDLWTNRQHLMLRMAEHTVVLYVESFSLVRLLAGRETVRNFSLGLRNIKPSLWIMKVPQLLSGGRYQIRALKQLDDLIKLRYIESALRRLELLNPILWLYFPPDPNAFIGRLGESVVCYHCTDDYTGYAGFVGWDENLIQRQEQQLIKRADLVFVTSRPLFEDKVKLNSNTFYMPNVADVQHFSRAMREDIMPPADMADIPRPVAGFWGAIDKFKIDFRLVERVARLLTHWSFVFIGPIGFSDGTRPEDLPRLPNLYYIGQRAYEDLPAYLKVFDVCILPYQLNSYTRGVFPLKFWEYSAGGKPVVATSLPSLREYSDLACLCTSPEEFAACIESSATYESSMAEKRHRTAAEHTWDQRAEEIVAILLRYG